MDQFPVGSTNKPTFLFPPSPGAHSLQLPSLVSCDVDKYKVHAPILTLSTLSPFSSYPFN